MKNKYVSPKIVVRGTIEEITQGSGWGIRDFFVFGITDAIGNMGGDSARLPCVVSS